MHPSRIVPFKGDPIPNSFGVSTEDAYWGRSRVTRILTEVQALDATKADFAYLVRKARLIWTAWFASGRSAARAEPTRR
ncbi:hypothetical protein [Sandaracinobacteroides sayramensis]|uniref:hypothetical protein n=1 Tax=Sandaracinobacteroides sayramensis TaxID=2913411 RepID=UPI003AB9609A